MPKQMAPLCRRHSSMFLPCLDCQRPNHDDYLPMGVFSAKWDALPLQKLYLANLSNFVLGGYGGPTDKRMPHRDGSGPLRVENPHPFLLSTRTGNHVSVLLPFFRTRLCFVATCCPKSMDTERRTSTNPISPGRISSLEFSSFACLRQRVSSNLSAVGCKC